MFRNTVSIWNICCWTCFRHSGCHKSMTDDTTLYLNWCFSVLAARIGLRFLGRTDWSHFGHNDLLNSTDCLNLNHLYMSLNCVTAANVYRAGFHRVSTVLLNMDATNLENSTFWKTVFFGSFRHFSCITFRHCTSVHWLWRVDASCSVKACIRDIRAICFRMSLEEWC